MSRAADVGEDEESQVQRRVDGVRSKHLTRASSWTCAHTSTTTTSGLTACSPERPRRSPCKPGQQITKRPGRGPATELCAISPAPPSLYRCARPASRAALAVDLDALDHRDRHRALHWPRSIRHTSTPCLLPFSRIRCIWGQFASRSCRPWCRRAPGRSGGCWRNS